MLYTFIHTYIHTYIHAYRPACEPCYKHTYWHIDVKIPILWKKHSTTFYVHSSEFFFVFLFSLSPAFFLILLCSGSKNKRQGLKIFLSAYNWFKKLFHIFIYIWLIPLPSLFFLYNDSLFKKTHLKIRQS